MGSVGTARRSFDGLGVCEDCAQRLKLKSFACRWFMIQILKAIGTPYPDIPTMECRPKAPQGTSWTVRKPIKTCQTHKTSRKRSKMTEIARAKSIKEREKLGFWQSIDEPPPPTLAKQKSLLRVQENDMWPSYLMGVFLRKRIWNEEWCLLE